MPREGRPQRRPAVRWDLSTALPRLRHNLDFLPSPSPEHPGLLIRDPFHYTDAMIVVPPPLVPCLEFFDGLRSELDLRAALVQMTGALDVGEVLSSLVGALSQSGFLEDETYEALRAEAQQQFAASPVREPAHAGGAYPSDPAVLRSALEQHMAPDPDSPSAPGGNLFALAAPHVSPEGGWRSYRDAYRVLTPEYKDRTFVILATSHYGEPEKFGLTAKPFRTPLGDAPADHEMVSWLAKRGGDAVSMDDYCHSFEHTVELQVVFLQHALGPNVRILPILCGPFVESLLNGGLPEKNDSVKRFFDALQELNGLQGERLFWVLGVDMAHMGRRYADSFTATADRGIMQEVASRDSDRIGRLREGDSAGFWDLVKPNHDDLKWCGSSPFYTFLKAAPEARGETLRYEQWNIDQDSVVSFGAMAFTRDAK